MTEEPPLFRSQDDAGPGLFDLRFRAHTRVRVCDEDAELFAGLPEHARDEARVRAVAPVLPLVRGPWRPRETGAPGPGGCLGLLVLDGLLLHSVTVGSDPRSELLGPGDVLRPWQHDEETASIPFASGWEVLHPGRLAVLDARFIAVACRRPQLMLAVADRMVRRSRRLAVQMAIADLRRIDDRLVLLFWHLADRWGHVCRDGVVVSLPVTHEVIAQLVCAHRPTVTSALARLAASGQLRRRPDRSWLLRPDPPPAPTRGRPALAAAVSAPA